MKSIAYPPPNDWRRLIAAVQAADEKRIEDEATPHRPRSHQIAPITGAESIEVTDSPHLIRMVGTGTCTEINDTRFGLLVPDADSAIFVPQECVVDCEKSGFRVCELTHSEKLGRVMDAIGDLDDGPDKTALKTAFAAQQLLVWRAIQARRATT